MMMSSWMDVTYTVLIIIIVPWKEKNTYNNWLSISMKMLSMYVDMLLYSSRLARLVPMEYSSSATLLQYLHGEGKVPTATVCNGGR